MPSPSPAIPIRRLLVRDLLTLVGLTVLLLLGATWMSATIILESQAKAQAQAGLRHLELGIRSRLDVAEQVGDSLELLWKRGLLAPEANPATEHLLHAELRGHPVISNLVISNADGVGISANNPDGHPFTRRVVGDGADRHIQESLWDDYGALQTHRWPQMKPIDWRTRPWFRQAQASPGAVWTDPYIFVNPPVPGLTYAVPLRNRAGQFQGALCIDLRLEELSRLLWEVQPTPHTQVILADGRRRALGLPNLPEFQGVDQRQRAFLREIGPAFLPVAYAVGDRPEAQQPGAWPRIRVGGADYFVQRRLLQGSKGPQWDLVIAIPTDDLLREPRQKALLSLMLGLGALGVLVWRLRVTSERVTRPLGDLAASSDALVRGEPLRIPDTNIYEVQHAAEAFEAASRTLVEKQKLEEHVRNSQRLELLGTMATGIAHDVNNQLGAISGQIGLVRLKSTSDAEHLPYLDKAERATAACGEITRALLTFGRPTQPKPQSVDLRALLEHTAGLLDHVRGREVRLELRLPESAPKVLGEAVQLEQVLMNLGINAKDAMPGGGTLTLATGSDEGGAWIRVSDTGSGMSPEVLEKLFTPFFSTKAERGTGLGLAMVFGIVKAHGGTIDVASAPGRGTTFTIRLPESP